MWNFELTDAGYIKFKDNILTLENKRVIIFSENILHVVKSGGTYFCRFSSNVIKYDDISGKFQENVPEEKVKNYKIKDRILEITLPERKEKILLKMKTEELTSIDISKNYVIYNYQNNIVLYHFPSKTWKKFISESDQVKISKDEKSFFFRIQGVFVKQVEISSGTSKIISI